MLDLTESKLSELSDRLERAESDAELDAIEAELGAVEGIDDECWTVPTLADVAKFFAVHEATVKSWRSQGMPGEPGSWNMRSIVRWRLAKAERRGLDFGDESERSLLREKTKLDIMRRRLELELKQGKLINVDEAAAINRELFSLIRARLEALPGEYASSVPADQRANVLAELSSKIRLALTELADMGEHPECSVTNMGLTRGK